MAKRESVTQRKAPKRRKRTDWKAAFRGVDSIRSMLIQVNAGLTAERDKLAAEVQELLAEMRKPLVPRYPHWACKTHGDFNAVIEVGCPECVRVLRESVKAKDEEIALLKAWKHDEQLRAQVQMEEMDWWKFWQSWKWWRRRAAERRETT